ncbi:fimbrial protein [Acinetobacter pullicarnis]|uniref:fimbrial protein n=1 Tax=Acinetobacter pullicarnis TaxID=2576829 RepID=UPI00112154B4|nr:fimbrial protein [Acinetobacter pullicarnis]
MNIYLKKILLSLGVLTSNSIYAACLPEPGFIIEQFNISMGDILVRANDPVGTILKSKSYPPGKLSSKFICEPKARPLEEFKLSKFTSKNNTVSDPYVYNTNISGIGIKITGSSGPYPRSLRFNEVGEAYVELDVKVDIIKTSMTTGSGSLEAGNYSTDYMQLEKPWLTTYMPANGTRIFTSSSCEFVESKDRIIVLPQISINNFKGQNTPANGDRNFNLNIKCVGGDGGSDQFGQAADLSFTFPVVLNNSLIGNTYNGADKATGVALQLSSLLQGKTNVLFNGATIDLGKQSSGQQNIINIPLKVRYWQIANTVSPGKVESRVTLNFIYK